LNNAVIGAEPGHRVLLEMLAAQTYGLLDRHSIDTATLAKCISSSFEDADAKAWISRERRRE